MTPDTAQGERPDCDVTCQFCGETEFDLPGLKSHLLEGDCEKFEAVERLFRMRWS